MRLRALAIVTLAVVMAACSSDRTPAVPTAPSAPPPSITNYTGTWHGSYVMTQCGGRRHCVLSIGQQNPFVLSLEQIGTRVTGVFQAEAWAVQVVGEVAADGGLTLAGHRNSPGWYLPAVEITKFTVRRSEVTGLQAELAFRVRYPDGTPEGMNSREQSVGGRVDAAERNIPTPLTPFAGRWTGALVIKECSFVGWTFCWPENLGEQWGYELTLAQTGNRVTGELNFRGRTAVTGTVSGDTLTLDPVTREDPQSGGRLFFRVQRWTMTRDRVGQVRGEMAYEREMAWEPSRNMPPYVSRYRGDLLYGILEP